MDVPNHNSPLSSAPLTSENGGPSSSAASSSQVQEEEESHQQEQEQQQRLSISYVPTTSTPNVLFSGTRNDAWSFLVVLVTFWFFISMTLILGIYGPVNLQLGPNCSRLLQASSFFVNEIKVQELTGPKHGLMLYGFYSPPSLDVETTWSETHYVSLPANSHKDWIYFLNEGSEVNISYNKSQSSSPLSLVVAKGIESLTEWIDNPLYPNITLSWNIIHGSGVIQQKIFKSSDYYIAVGNSNPLEVEVQLKFRIQALLHNTTEAYYKCSLTHGLCGLKFFFMGSNAAVLTSSLSEQGTPSDDWNVKISYDPRWISYFVGSGAMTILVVLVFKICAKFQSTTSDGTGFQSGEEGSERAPLLAPKDDDLSSWGSSCDSISHDEEDLENQFAVGSLETKQLKDGENINPRRLCVICFDASRDCFFLPCGHCAACFTCGTRIVEEAGTCPICRRKMKKVRKIFTV